MRASGERTGWLADPRTRRQLRTLVRVVALACVVTPVFNVLTDEVSWSAVGQGAIDAFFVSSVVGGYLLLVRDGVLRIRFRQLPFLPDLVLNAAVVLLLFVVARGAGQVIGDGRLERFHQSLLDPHLRLALPFFVLFAFALTFVLRMNRMVGTNVLGYFLAGAYHGRSRSGASSCSSISPARRSTRSASAARATTSCCGASSTTSRSRSSRPRARSTSTRVTRW